MKMKFQVALRLSVPRLQVRWQLLLLRDPGVCLKSEAMNLAVITELPLVVINVQRGGPSTGLPTKSEQTDLLQALFGRNGESPMPVIAAASPTHCFDAAYDACKIALEHMTGGVAD